MVREARQEMSGRPKAAWEVAGAATAFAKDSSSRGPLQETHPQSFRPLVSGKCEGGGGGRPWPPGIQLGCSVGVVPLGGV